VLYVFYKTPRLRTVTSYYIITLAISDIAMAVLIMPPIIAVSACGCDALGFYVGTVIQWILTEILFGSLQTTSLIAVNRYFCVVKPAKYRKYFRPKKVILMIAMCWIANLVPTIGIYIGGITSMDFYASRYMRFPYFIGPHTGHIITAIYQVLFTVVPAILSTICYWKIHQQIKSHNASLASKRNTNGASTSLSVAPNREVFSSVVSNGISSKSTAQNREDSVVSNQPTSSSVVSNYISLSSVEPRRASSVEGNRTSSLQVVRNQMSSSVAQIPSQSMASLVASNRTTVESNRTLSLSVEEIKITKSLMVIVIGFCICWLPSSTVLHLSTYIRLPRLVEALLIYFGCTSSAINPILYNIYNRPFRRRAWQLLRHRNVVTVESLGLSSKLPGARTTDHRSDFTSRSFEK